MMIYTFQLLLTIAFMYVLFELWTYQRKLVKKTEESQAILDLFWKSEKNIKIILHSLEMRQKAILDEQEKPKSKIGRPKKNRQ